MAPASALSGDRTISDMMNYMNAGSTAELITLSEDTVKAKITTAVTRILREDNFKVFEGDVSKAIFAGLAIVSTVSNVLRVPTKEDVAARVQESISRKKPRLNGVGERQSVAKILNSDERLAKGNEYTENKNEEIKLKAAKEVEKLGRRRIEFPLLQKCKEVGLTQIVPNSKAGHLYSLLKSELIGLCTKLELEADCKNVCKKKFSSLNRTELGDYLLEKLKETEKVIDAVPTEEGVTAPILVPNTSSATDMLEDVTAMAKQECSKKFTSWEELNEYLHSRYGSGSAILESIPSCSDILDLHNFYIGGSEDDMFMVDSSWYKYPQFKFHSITV